jgi:hypothetical protein
VSGTWSKVYDAEVVVVISANVNNVVMQNLFTAGDWTSTKRKRVVINPGVVVGATSTGVVAFATGTGGVGQLVLDNNGSIHAAGGAPNSGAGGHAINVQQSGLTINNAGAIRSGGGAGGVGGGGGTGGGGFYDYGVDSGRQYARNSYDWAYSTGSGVFNIYWGGGLQYTSGGSSSSIKTQVVGGYTYTKFNTEGGGLGVEQISGVYHYAISQYYVARAYTSGGGGGAGGNGGYGQGSNWNATGGNGGNPGAGGGTNAGSGGYGGTGGTGGTWGAVGNTGGAGATGNAGNNGGGTAGGGGAAGGAAGVAIYGTPRTVNNTGTITGAQQ